MILDLVSSGLSKVWDVWFSALTIDIMIGASIFYAFYLMLYIYKEWVAKIHQQKSAAVIKKLYCPGNCEGCALSKDGIEKTKVGTPIAGFLALNLGILLWPISVVAGATYVTYWSIKYMAFRAHNAIALTSSDKKIRAEAQKFGK